MQELIQQNLSLFSKNYPDIKYLKQLKSGKEAEVHLVHADRQLMALKIYKQHTKYSSRGEYLHLHELGTGHVMRAIKRKGKIGKRLMGDVWVTREYELMRKLNKRGADVPEVYALGQNAFLMEYFGDEISPAPKLIDVKLTPEQAENAFEIIKENIILLLELGYVHGDLSGYNILWWKDFPYIIDFPQVLNIFHNTDSVEKLNHDIGEINKYFSDYGLTITPEEIIDMQQNLVF